MKQASLEKGTVTAIKTIKQYCKWKGNDCTGCAIRDWCKEHTDDCDPEYWKIRKYKTKEVKK